MERILYMQSINFENLRPHWEDLANLAAHAEAYAHSDPQSALVKLRCFAEKLVGVVFDRYKIPSYPNENFIDRLNNHNFTSLVDQGIVDKLHAIRKVGNRAAHEGKFNKTDPLWLLKEAHILGSWLLISTGAGSSADLCEFKAPEQIRQPSKAELEKHAAQLEKALAELEAVKQAELQAQAENARLQQELEAKDKALADLQLVEALEQLRQRNQAAGSVLDYNEDETRRRMIDKDLYSAGWDINLADSDPKTGNTEQVHREVQVNGQPTATGIGYCDYVLWGDDGKPLAVIEAKRARENSQKGQQQAKLYADALEKQYGQRPVIFYTNGRDITIWNDAQGEAPRKLYGYYAKASLEYLIQQRSGPRNLLGTRIDTDVAGRDYQIEAITRVCERYAANHRKALVVQATGTGKTRVSIALSKRMIEAGWSKRILFLCDRKELRKQAGKAYTEFMAEPVYIVGKSKKSDMTNARIYISTYPGMMNIMENFDVGYFDLIIADESHRSIYNVYGDLFKYFDALQLGLTATPVEMISRSTSQLFGCDYKQPTANYPLEKAIEDRNLVPFKVVAHTTQFLREGIRGNNLSDEQIAQLEDQGIDPNTLDFDSKLIDKAIYNKDTNRAILRNLMENGLRLADGQTLGKSMIFARNIKHAELLYELFNEMYPDYAQTTSGNFCRVIHSQYDRAEELIDDFKLTDGSSSQVTIAISVDMLDTGIDVPEVLNLVFAKPVKSKVKFWQMVGRGTRLCKGLFGLNPDGSSRDKEKFLIFDHWGNFEYFNLDHEEEEPRQPKSLAQQLFEARLMFAEEALKQAALADFTVMIDLIKQDIDSLNDNTIAIRDNWRLKEQLANRELLLQFSPTTKNALREQMAPLMQWRNIQGETEALRFDLDIVNAQYAQLLNRTQNQPKLINDSRQPIQQKVRSLLMNMNQVRNKADTVAKLQRDDFWKQDNVRDLELARQDIRSVIHLRDKTVNPLPADVTPIIDIAEDREKFETAEVKTQIRTVDYEIYRREVEASLTPLFDSNPTLQKIRAGETISEQELNDLNSLLHTRNSKVDLNLLKEFFPDSAAGVDQLLRAIIGLDRDAIEARFNDFLQQHHIHLNSQQQRFISLLKSEICRSGSMTVERLYDAPFSQLHQDGIDGLFQDEQATLIARFVAGFTVKSGQRKATAETCN
ncbi:DEAD/DEAH box helicase family protein [Parathalassolituus penaei]|uniref:DEAD/DEAH box helicase family protein n=1 Tax=Parathalassolituus penaei TaxID=2997323 RepID=A0A9X3ENA5_9GAMM|nr:DEAD/DEAH box helicase family protein [Parathalassolituus penaei]MCY0965803.1 DEAD/DEAH box helicase family protein [Parathalassolituus penaei]